MKEIWKDIEGYECYYQISNFGRVKSLERISTQNVLIKERLLKQNIRKEYYYVELNKDGYAKKYSIHRLVGQAFISNPENYPCINHIDENKLNNNVENLEWITVKGNVNHGTRNKRSSEYQHCKNFGKKRGIYKVNNKWKAQIKLFENNSQVYLGRFDNKEEAYQAFYNAYVKYYGTNPW